MMRWLRKLANVRRREKVWGVTSGAKFNPLTNVVLLVRTRCLLKLPVSPDLHSDGSSDICCTSGRGTYDPVVGIGGSVDVDICDLFS